MANITLPKDVEYALEKLQASGFDAFIVGGCVRDSIMGITPNDWDICTSARPDQVISVFNGHKVIETGLQHGTVTVILNNNSYEITTYRIDGEYKDNRHPENVDFVRDIKLDLMRRDFTVNAMAYNQKSDVVDYFGGINDIQNGIIRCVGNPSDRFIEDALRIIRAVRFAIRYDFSIEPTTRDAMMLHKSTLKRISIERINAEIMKVLQSNLEGRAELLYDFVTLLSEIVPEFKEKNIYAICKRLAESIDIIDVRLAILFDFSQIETETILKRLRFSNNIVSSVVAINRFGNKVLNDCGWQEFITPMLPFEQYNKPDYYERLFLHNAGFETAIASIEYALAHTNHNSREEMMLNTLEWRVGKCFENNEPYQLSDMMVDGNDMLRLGYKGKSIGKILNVLLDMVMKGFLKNEKEALISAAKYMED